MVIPRCTYEVGTFLRAKKQKPILVIPVKLAVILCLFSAAELVIMTGYFMSTELHLVDGLVTLQQLWSFFLLFSLFYMPALPLLFYLAIGMMADLKELPGQLREFRVQDAKCFCCSHNHRHPDTGEVLLCDREMMFKMLKKWFGKADDLQEEHLEVFNRLVHEDLAPQVLKSVGSDILPFNYCILALIQRLLCSYWVSEDKSLTSFILKWPLGTKPGMYMVVVHSLPGLCTLIPTLADGVESSFNFLQHGIWASRRIMNWIFAGLIMLYALRLSTRGWLIALRLSPRSTRGRLICSFVFPLILSLMLLGRSETGK